LKRQVQRNETQLVDEKHGKNIMDMSYPKEVKRNWSHLQCGNRVD